MSSLKSRNATLVRHLFGAATIAMAVGSSQYAFAQTARAEPLADAEALPPSEKSDEIIVTGIRGALSTAAGQKRAADVIQDGISADDIGNIPDLDLGEALVRIPGVQIDREAERRSSSISVRGLGAAFTKTTVMGQNIASPATGRFRVNPFGAFDSSIFSGANVIKSFTPDIQSGGLAANVDLRIQPALARKDGQFVVRAELGYEELPEAVTPGLFFSGSKHFADGTFGVFGTVAYSTQRFRRDIVTVNGYTNLIGAATTANPTGIISNVGRTPTERTALIASISALDPNPAVANDYSVLVPTSFRQFSELSDGNRISAVGGFEWQPMEGLSIRADAIITRRELDQNLLDTVEFNIAQNANALFAPIGQAVRAGDFDQILGADAGDTEAVYYFPNVEFRNPQYSPGNRSFNFLEQTWAIYPQVSFKNDDWNVQAIATLSKARNEFVQEQFFVSALATGGALGQNGITGSFNTGSGNIGDYQFLLNHTSGSINNAFVFTGLPLVPDNANTTGTGNAATFNGGRNQFQLTANNQRVKRSLYSSQLDIERFVDFGPISSIKIGGRYQRDNALNLRQNNSLFGARIENLNSSILQLNSTLTSGGAFFGGQAPGALGLQGQTLGNNGFLSLDLDLVRSLLLPIDITRVPAGIEPNFLSDWYQSRANLTALNWRSNRENIEGYAMAKFKVEDLGGMKVRGNFGVRYAKTDIGGNLLTSLFGAKSSNDAWLPSANLIVDVTNNLVFNAAYYHTFESLDLTEFSPAPTSYSAINDTSDGVFDLDILSVTVNALDRRPRTSKAVDLGLTWYNRTGSLVGVNLYYKKISANYEQLQVCADTAVEAFLPTNITVSGLSPDVSNVCRNSSPIDGVLFGGLPTTAPVGTDVRVLRFVPNAKDLVLKGVEAQIQQNLSFLDGWISGFGMQANYSYVKPNQKVFNVSRYTYNLIAYYETDDFAIRLARNTRAKNLLPAGGGFQGGERAVRGRSQLDLSIRITPVKDFDIRLEAFNLTNVQRREYEFIPEIVRRTDYDGRTFGLSVQTKF
jgi:iron complex outermembrane recepter protein